MKMSKLKYIMGLGLAVTLFGCGSNQRKESINDNYSPDTSISGEVKIEVKNSAVEKEDKRQHTLSLDETLLLCAGHTNLWKKEVVFAGKAELGKCCYEPASESIEKIIDKLHEINTQKGIISTEKGIVVFCGYASASSIKDCSFPRDYNNFQFSFDRAFYVGRMVEIKYGYKLLDTVKIVYPRGGRENKDEVDVYFVRNSKDDYSEREQRQIKMIFGWRG